MSFSSFEIRTQAGTEEIIDGFRKESNEAEPDTPASTRDPGPASARGPGPIESPRRLGMVQVMVRRSPGLTAPWATPSRDEVVEVERS